MVLSLASANICIALVGQNNARCCAHQDDISSLSANCVSLFCYEADEAVGGHLGSPRGHQSNPGQSQVWMKAL